MRLRRCGCCGPNDRRGCRTSRPGPGESGPASSAGRRLRRRTVAGLAHGGRSRGATEGAGRLRYAGGPAPTAGAEIVVHVVGQVVRPGLVRLRPGRAGGRRGRGRRWRARRSRSRGPQPRPARRRRRAAPRAEAGGAPCRAAGGGGAGGSGAGGRGGRRLARRWSVPSSASTRPTVAALDTLPGVGPGSRPADPRLARRARPIHLGRRAGRGERHRRQAARPAAAAGDAVTPRAPAPPREREQAPRGPSLVVLTGRETVRRVRPRTSRRLDLRLLVPVAVVWPVVAFWGLVGPSGSWPGRADGARDGVLSAVVATGGGTPGPRRPGPARPRRPGAGAPAERARPWARRSSATSRRCVPCWPCSSARRSATGRSDRGPGRRPRRRPRRGHGPGHGRG